MAKKVICVFMAALLFLLSACGTIGNKTTPTPVVTPTWNSLVEDETVDDNFVITSYTYTVDDFNSERGVNQMIYYTRMRGETTHTNEWGNEVVVDNGRVVQTGGNNLPIPERGFVLSGNDGNARFLFDEVPMGALCEVDRDTGILTVTMDKQAYITASLTMLRTCKDQLERYKTSNATYDEAAALVAQMEAMIASIRQSADGDAIMNTYDELKTLYKTAYPICIPSYENETRATWHNLLKTQTKEGIRADMTRIAEAGFNVVFLDVFAVGLVCYPNSQYAPMLPYADVGFDVLEELITVAHELGMEVHACTNNFLIGASGFEYDSETGSLLMDAHPDWVTTTKDGNYISNHEPGGIMFNPAMPEVRQFLTDVYAEIIDNYDVDGINLDFIRYLPDGSSVDDAMGMDPYSVNAFQEATGIDIMSVTKMDTDEWKSFIQWRADQVSALVESVRKMIDTKNKELDRDVQLSACVVGIPNVALNTKMQDWPKWLNEGWLDFIAPMSYYQYGPPVYQEITAMLELCPGTTIVAGLSFNYTNSVMLFNEQVTAARDAGAMGVAFFSSYNINNRQTQIMTAGAFRTKAKPLYEVVIRDSVAESS